MLQDLRLALRLLRVNPGFTAAAILTLALGIGANTAIFSVVDGVLLRASPIEAIERLAVIWETDRHSGTTREPASVPDYLDFETRSRSMEAMAAVMATEVNLVPPGGDPVRLAALAVSHRLLPMIGIQAIAGRLFTSDDDRAGGPSLAVISESLWARAFGRDPAVVGATLRLDDQPHTIVGVLPDAADFGILQVLLAADYARGFADRDERSNVDVWVPLQADPARLPRQTHPIIVLGRLSPGSSFGHAQQELAGIAADLERAHPENDGRGVSVEPLEQVVFGPSRPALLVLFAAVALVLLVASVNVANLLLARGAARAREVAVRHALGATRSRLARQFLVENLVVALAAAAAGVGLALAGLRVLLAMAPAEVPRLAMVAIDRRVLLATLAVSVLVGLVFGMIPTAQAGRVDLQQALRDDGGSRASAGRGRRRLLAGLVVAEVALAVLLTTGAGLLIRSFWRLQQVRPGFDATGVLKAEYQLPPSRYPVDFAKWPDFAEMHAFTRTLLDGARRLPGVESAAVAGNHPLDPGFTNSFVVEGRETEAQSWPEISVRRVSPGYFRTVGLPLVRGRLLREADQTRSAPVLLVNEAAARRFFAGRDPLGARIAFWGASRTVVGVVANEKFHGLAEAPPIAVYVPLAQAPSATGAAVLLVRTSGDPRRLAPAVDRLIREIDPGLAVFGMEPLEQTVWRSVSRRRFVMLLLGLFAAVALLLASLGVHGVLSYGLSQRRQEIGVRLALGAAPGRVWRLVAMEGAQLALAGLALGLLASLALARLLASLLFGVSAHDPATLLSVAALLLLVAIGATALPAWRATRTDPASVLRARG
jgi:putative ABC transport system permease protein